MALGTERSGPDRGRRIRPEGLDHRNEDRDREREQVGLRRRLVHPTLVHRERLVVARRGEGAQVARGGLWAPPPVSRRGGLPAPGGGGPPGFRAGPGATGLDTLPPLV